MVLYENQIEIHSNHTLNKINININPDIEEIFTHDYENMVSIELSEIEGKYSTEIKRLGRSGRHLCLERTYSNIKNYFKIREEVLKAEERIVNYFNKDWLGEKYEQRGN